MSEVLTPLQTIREQGLEARMFNGKLIVSPWNRMTHEQYIYIGENAFEIITELNAEAVAAGNADNLCGYGAGYVPEVANNDYASWYLPDSLKVSMGYQEPSWRIGVNRAHGRPDLA